MPTRFTLSLSSKKLRLHLFHLQCYKPNVSRHDVGYFFAYVTSFYILKLPDWAEVSYPPLIVICLSLPRLTQEQRKEKNTLVVPLPRSIRRHILLITLISLFTFFTFHFFHFFFECPVRYVRGYVYRVMSLMNHKRKTNFMT